MQTTSDEALIKRIADGDRVAMQVLFARHHVRVYRFVLRLVGDPSRAEDLISEVFQDIWRQADRFEARSQVSTWLLAIARYKALSELRRRPDEGLDNETAAAIEQPIGPDDPKQKVDASDILRDSLTKLSQEHREIIDLVYYREKSIEEAAQIIGIPENAVKTRIFYARKAWNAAAHVEGSGTFTDRYDTSAAFARTMGLSGDVVRVRFVNSQRTDSRRTRRRSASDLLDKVAEEAATALGLPALASKHAEFAALGRISSEKLAREPSKPTGARRHDNDAGGPPQNRGGRSGGRGVSGDVVVTAFAPDAITRDDLLLVQVYLHRSDQAAIAASRARRADVGARERGIATLEIDIESGQRVGISLEGRDAEIDDPVQSVVWRGQPSSCTFLVSSSAHTKMRVLHLRVRIDVDGLQVGSIRFGVRVAKAPDKARREIRPRGDSSNRYRRAFLSHAHDDAADVFKIAQAYQAAGIEFFHDIVSLRAGSEWEKRLFSEIDRCDLFLLFWTKRAAESSWVRAETEYAIKRKGASANDLPDIVPILLTGTLPDLPDWLRHIHVDHLFRLAIRGIEAGKQAETS